MPNRRDFSKQSLAAFAGILLGERGLNEMMIGWLPPAGRRLSQDSQASGVNGTRLNANLAALSRYGANPQGGVSRVAYSQADLDGRSYVMSLIRQAGLEPRIDTAGNILARRPGSDPSLKPICIGSHIDSVPDGGNYDGTVGSLGALEVLQTLGERKVATRHPLELLIFQNEEGGTVGSRAMAGELHGPALDLTARSGKTIRDGIGFIGGNVSRLSEAARKAGDMAAYVELHIEQGGSLERDGKDIGVVEGIVGIGWWDVTIEGFANHAGTTEMGQRRDAMLAAARFTDMVNRVITSEAGRQVGTVGRMAAFPGAPNVIPGRVDCSLEIRDLDSARIRHFYEAVVREAEGIGKATGTTFAFKETYVSKPAIMHSGVQKTVEAAASGLGLSTRYLPSGAGHDAQYMSTLCPTGMIFIPSKDGISHAPQEFSTPADITNGANVLLQTVIALDSTNRV